MFPSQRSLTKLFIPILSIAVVAAIHSAEQQHGTVPSCAGSGSCSGDLNQPLLELLQPKGALTDSTQPMS